MSGAAQASDVHDRELGVALRTMRTRRGWRQEDLARVAKASREMVGRIERGHADSVALGDLRRVTAALDGRLDTVVRWHGGDLGRLLSARHSAMHESMALQLGSLRDWRFEPEVSFSIYGERGVIDILGWNAVARALLVIELKTEFVDMNETMGTLDRKDRLAVVIARERGWNPATTSVWLVVADGRTVRGWLNRPVGRVQALSFLPNDAVVPVRSGLGPARRVSRVRPRRDPS
jgi:transcriptional regulator with XRE-family HTH domain